MHNHQQHPCCLQLRRVEELEDDTQLAEDRALHAEMQMSHLEKELAHAHDLEILRRHEVSSGPKQQCPAVSG